LKKTGKKKILVCPLDWGLGHASRDVPIIQRLVDMDHEVVLAGDGAAMDLLRTEFPELESLYLRSVIRMRYSRRLPAWLKITLLSPLLFIEIFSEHLSIRRIIRDIKPDVLISDNRYGLWNRRVRSILITHQLSIRLPRFARFLEYPFHVVIRAFIGKFDRCWIPDYPGEANLSGELSHRYPLTGNSAFIGVISRFAVPPGKTTRTSSRFLGHPNIGPPGLSRPAAVPGEVTRDLSGTVSAAGPGISIPGPRITVPRKPRPVDLVVLLSGPEPQRSVLQKLVLRQALTLNCGCVILQGLPGRSRRVDLTSSTTMYSHMPAGELGKLLDMAEHIICRAGYTGIMDLAVLRKKAMIIPTPGQTEQEDLAGYLAEKGIFLACSQDELDLESALEDLREFEPEFNLPADDLLESAIREIV
jgi:UDP:flavonoid glycosyltransferase YjiC (YdhE family)